MKDCSIFISSSDSYSDLWPVFFMNVGIPRLLLVIIISSITFFLVVWFVGFTNEEQTKLKYILKILFKKNKY